MIQSWYYLLALSVSIAGLFMLDYRYKLAFAKSAKRSGIAIFISMAIFIVWDALGIYMGIFFHGGSKYSLPFRIAPEFPIEELFFLFLLCYTALLLYLAGSKLWPRT